MEEMVKYRTFGELENLVTGWAADKGLLDIENAEKQFLKFVEEAVEFKAEMDRVLFYVLIRERDEHQIKKMEMEMGDILVTLIVLSAQLDIDLEQSLAMAYDKIEGRTGKTINGMFVKSEDL